MRRRLRFAKALLVSLLLAIAGLCMGAGFYETGGQYGVTATGLSGYRGLKVTTTGALDNVSVLISADKLTLSDDSDGVKVLTSVSVTDNLAAAGAGGLDNGALAKNTGYFLYVVWNGSTAAALASTSATAPVLPSGYTKKVRVSWVTTDNTNAPYNVEEFTQVDDTYQWELKQKIIDNGGTPLNTTATVNLAAGGVKTYAVVPATVTKGIFGKVMMNVSSGVWNYSHATFPNSTGADNDNTYSVSNYGALFPLPWNIPVLTEQQTFYHQLSANTVEVWVAGFTLKQ